MIEDTIIRDLDFQPRLTRAQDRIAAMAEARLKPRQISGRDIVPAHIRERYEQLWQDEDRALFAARAARKKHLFARIRIWLFGER